MAKPTKPDADRTRWSFGTLLRWHLQHGTRPDGHPDRPGIKWKQKDFAGSCGYGADSNVRRWINDSDKPNFERIAAALFGTSDVYREWRNELFRAWTGESQVEHVAPVGAVPLPGPCLGRGADTDRIVAGVLGDRPYVLVQGPGGIGKTTLTQQAAHDGRVAARFGERRWYAELETATAPIDFDAAVLRALGLEASAGFGAALAKLGQAPGLLVLDNLETPHAPPHGSAIESRLGELAAVPGLALLASFRGRSVSAASAGERGSRSGRWNRLSRRSCSWKSRRSFRPRTRHCPGSSTRSAGCRWRFA